MNIQDIEKIVQFQFQDIKSATKEFAVIEVSKFCKFVVNQTKIKNLIVGYKIGIEKINTELASENIEGQRKHKLTIDLKLFSDYIVYLNSKLREPLPPTRHKEGNQRRKEIKQLQQQVNNREPILMSLNEWDEVVNQ